MSTKKRLMSLFLSVVMVLSLLPTAAFAASSVSMSAAFDGALTAGESSYTAKMSVDFSDLTECTGYGMVIDWTSLGGYITDVWSDAEYGYVKGVTVDANANVKGVASAFSVYNKPASWTAGSVQTPLTETQTYVAFSSARAARNMTGVATVEFALGEIPAGTYDVSVKMFECMDGAGDFAVVPAQQSTWKTTTATLTVKNPDGSNPEPVTPPATQHNIQASVMSGDTTGTITIANKAAEDDTVSFSVAPTTGYEIKTVTVTNLLNGATVDVRNTSAVGTAATAINTYEFTMPAADVHVQVTFDTHTPDDVHDTAYGISVSNTISNGAVHTNGVNEANEGDTVTLYVTPDSGYEIESVTVTAANGAAVTVTGGSQQSGDAFLYTFSMPASAVTASATFKAVPVTPPAPGEDVASGYIRVKGTVLTSNQHPLPNATVQLVYENGAHANQVAATTTSGEDGTFVLSDVDNSYTYKLKATYDTKVIKGAPADPGFLVYSQECSISASSTNQDGHGEVVSQTLTIALFYEWDVDGDTNIERIYAGQDDRFFTTDDYYQTTVGRDNTPVNVYADSTGKIQSETAYYLWEVDTDGIKEQVFVGGGFKAGTENDYYLFDVDHNPDTDDVMVYIGADKTPATSDDYYDSVDVNNDGTTDKVSAGADGLIATEDDWYVVGGTTIYAGEDKVAGTADDWYSEDTDHDGVQHDGSDNEKVYVGRDRLPHTKDDYYQEDVNGDGQLENILAGEDARFNTSDDYYEDIVGERTVKVYPGSTGDSNDPYEFGLRDDHYDWSINQVAVVVRVGDDKQAGTSDDEFDWNIKDDGPSDAGVTVQVIVIAGPDGVPGTDDDYYMFDADNDGVDEKVIVGEDGIAGTDDDYYDKDVDGATGDERVYAGNDGIFDTSDDHYFDEVDGKTVDVIAGADGHIGTKDDYYDWHCSFDSDGVTRPVFVGDDEQAGTSDDYYLYDVNGDNVNEEIKAGENGIPGTPDDHYAFNADDDAALEDVFVGRDSKPGTNDDYYDEDVNGDGNDERVYAGPEANGDGKFGTEDDFYHAIVKDPANPENTVVVPVFAGEDKHFSDPDADPASDDYYLYDVNGDGTDEKIFIDGDSFAGTNDDWYYKDVDGDGTPEKVFVGEDEIPMTEDDYYIKDVNGDGDTEQVFAGEDSEFGTKDDWYPEDIDGDGHDEKIEAGEDGKIGTGDDFYEFDVDKDGDNEKVFVGEDKDPGTSDDYYLSDPDRDGEDEKIFADGDGIPGTNDDYYYSDPDKDGTDDVIHVGPDAKPGTPDDWYEKDVDGDGDKEVIHVGPDGTPGTKDDYYEQDIDNDGEEEEIRSGEDAIIGTEDDEYDKDVDGDGDKETNYVGPDKKPGTADDWYYPIITFDAGYGTVNGGSKFSIISSDLTALPTASRGGYSFQGWTLANSSAILTLEQVLALKVDTTVYASFRSNHTGGGGGGGGGGSVSVTTYTVTFDSNGGSAVKSQSVASGGKVTKPAAPTRDGYKFTGWYTDSACKNEYDFTTVVKKGFTLYAGWEKNNVSENVFGLLTSDHIAYIVGFDDGMVHGEKNMTRAQAAMVFYRLLNDEARAKYQSSKNSFVDCPANAWYNVAVSTLTNAKVLAGYSNGKFGPNDPITRAQFATICARIGKLEATYAHSFSDVPTSYWAYEYITAAADQGWVSGFGNDKFGPDQYITRSQVVAILNRVLERDDVTSDSFSKFMSDSDFINWSDNMDSSAWDYLYLIEAGNGHDYTRDADGVEIWTALAD